MKTLRKISLDGFDRLSITEASRLFGGNGDNPPTTSTVPNDSIGSNRNDSIPPKTTPKQTISVDLKHEQNNSTTTQGTYKLETTGGFFVGGAAGWNSKTGGFGGVTVGFTFGGQKK